MEDPISYFGFPFIFSFFWIFFGYGQRHVPAKLSLAFLEALLDITVDMGIMVGYRSDYWLVDIGY